jgi:hypothetical protein
METYVASYGRQRVAYHTEYGGPWLIGLGITRRIIPLERTASFGWRTAHGGFGMVDRHHSSGVVLMTSIRDGTPLWLDMDVVHVGSRTRTERS